VSEVFQAYDVYMNRKRDVYDVKPFRVKLQKIFESTIQNIKDIRVAPKPKGSTIPESEEWET